MINATHIAVVNAFRCLRISKYSRKGMARQLLPTPHFQRVIAITLGYAVGNIWVKMRVLASPLARKRYWPQEPAGGHVETAALGCLAEQGAMDVPPLVEKPSVELCSNWTAGGGCPHVASGDP
jgi:hypothetical protein